ncbi:MAG: cytochrome c biogenesis CcdA family protein [Candidatus Bathyarchaeia archaeon]
MYLSSKIINILAVTLAVSILLVATMNAVSTFKVEEDKGVRGGLEADDVIGKPPIVFEPMAGLRIDNKTHAIFFYYTTCPACDDGENLFISRSYPTWQGNLTREEVSFEAINYYRKKEIGEAYFRAFNVSRSQFGGSFLIVHNSRMGLIYYPPFDDMKVQKAIYYLTRGSMGGSTSGRGNQYLSQPLIYILGVASGFNPCLIALISFFFATATQTELKDATRRIGLVSIGLLYTYILLFSLIISTPSVMSSIGSLTWIIVLILVALGLLHFIEVSHDLYARRWGLGSGIEAKIFLFRTPRFLKTLLSKVEETNSPLFDFTLGVLFSLVKFPCIAALLIVLLVRSTSPLIDIVIFTFGVASPVILLGMLIGFGMVKVNRLNTLQFRGRLIQRVLIGASLIISAILVAP